MSDLNNVFLFFIGLVFVLSLTGLLCYHSSLIARNRTTLGTWANTGDYYHIIAAFFKIIFVIIVVSNEHSRSKWAAQYKLMI